MWEASEDGCYVALTHDHLNVQDVMNRVRSPAAGAIVLFAGKSPTLLWQQEYRTNISQEQHGTTLVASPSRSSSTHHTTNSPCGPCSALPKISSPSTVSRASPWCTASGRYPSARRASSLRSHHRIAKPRGARGKRRWKSAKPRWKFGSVRSLRGKKACGGRTETAQWVKELQGEDLSRGMEKTIVIQHICIYKSQNT